MAISMPVNQPIPRTQGVIAIFFVLIIALLVSTAHAIIMHATIIRWRLWGLISGGEILVYWLSLASLVHYFGSFAGVTAIMSLIVGIGTASCQSLLLRSQTPKAQLWMLGSFCAWCLATILALYVEQMLPTTVLRVIWGVATARAIYGVGSSAALAWLLTAKDSSIDLVQSM
jgi:hypothetical protein